MPATLPSSKEIFCQWQSAVSEIAQGREAIKGCAGTPDGMGHVAVCAEMFVQHHAEVLSCLLDPQLLSSVQLGVVGRSSRRKMISYLRFFVIPFYGILLTFQGRRWPVSILH